LRIIIENKQNDDTDLDLDIEFSNVDSMYILLKGLYLLQNDNMLFLKYLSKIEENYDEDTADSLLELLSDHYQDNKNNTLDIFGNSVPIISPIKINKL